MRLNCLQADTSQNGTQSSSAFAERSAKRIKADVNTATEGSRPKVALVTGITGQVRLRPCYKHPITPLPVKPF